MKEQMLQILTEVSKGEKSPEIANNELLGLLSTIDSFDFDSTNLTFNEQMQLRMLLSTGKVIIKIAL